MMSMQHSDRLSHGLLHAFVLDGCGSAQAIGFSELEHLQLTEQQSVWLHWERSHLLTEQWLRESSGLSEFSRELLLEENTRPRLLRLDNQELLVFLRAINLILKPSLRIWFHCVFLLMPSILTHCVSGRYRSPMICCGPLRKAKVLKILQRFCFFLAQSLTDRVEHVVSDLGDTVDQEEARTDSDELYIPSPLGYVTGAAYSGQLTAVLSTTKRCFFGVDAHSRIMVLS